MKYCNHCGEHNSDDRITCWKCGDKLLNSLESKFCINCHETCITKSNICPQCGGSLVLESDSKNNSSNVGNVADWMRTISFFIPLLGIILGLIKITQKDEEGGKILITASIVNAVMVAIIIAILFLLGDYFNQYIK